jgi:hypothetical protein
MPTNLDLIAVGDITQHFVVPAYQRGYRWGADEVTVLLDDIASIREKDDKDYCLQPIVVKKLDGNRYELVDGQQRLTTLYLLFLVMQKEGFKRSGPPFSLEYTTRPQSAEFLQNLDPHRADENIDFFHLSGAYECIRSWFTQHGNRDQVVADQVNIHLYNRVKFIWYEATPDTDSNALFARLNIGRIPLTNAELIKALFLTRTVANPGDANRQVEIGMQWDVIERDLHEERFWGFLTDRSPDAHPTRIELLFDLIADRRSSDRFHTFRHFKALFEAGRRRTDVWNDVLARHALLREWYDDRNLYHRIGFLVATKEGDQDLRTLIDESATATKTQFARDLHAKIVDRLDLTREAIGELDYGGDRRKCERVLLLFNVETTRLLEQSSERYPFDAHNRNDWSLEHIHAQNAEALTRLDQWQEWLRAHARALAQLNLPEAAAERDSLVTAIDTSLNALTKERFTDLAGQVLAMFSRFEQADNLDGIENLALLPREVNSTLNNAAFEVKRQRIIATDRRGAYIPICTRRVFLKYYTESADQQLQFWSRQDRDAYQAAMFADESGILTPYLRSDS